jgi:predicted nucleotidyltransferase
VKTPRPDFATILEVLVRHEVDFIVIGGVCGVLHGAPITTLDLDIVHSRTPENVARLLAALEELGARYRTHPEQQLRPTRAHLESPGHQLLMTSSGPLDLLGAVGRGRSFGELVDRSVEVRLGAIQVRVLDLDALIEIKEEVGHEKDRAVLAILRRTLEEKRRR